MDTTHCVYLKLAQMFSIERLCSDNYLSNGNSIRSCLSFNEDNLCCCITIVFTHS